MGVEIVVPLGCFLMVVAIVWVIFYFGQKRQAAVQTTLRETIQSGAPLSVELVKAIGAPRSRKDADLRRGVVLLATALAFVVFAWMIGFEEQEAVWPLIGMAAFPGLIGLAFVGLQFFGAQED